MDIKVVDTKDHGLTGYLEITIQAVETTDTGTREGPLRTYGIASEIIHSGYGGSLENWLQAVKTEHLKQHGLHTSVVQQLHSMKGKVIE
jgi:hypothetical protein